MDDQTSGADVNSHIIHIRVQQRNGRKCVTTVTGIDPAFDQQKMCKYLKKAMRCNGTHLVDPNFGEILQFQGDHRVAVQQFITEEGIGQRENIKIHGA
ncbi:MAG: hypothetical protein KVP17_002252 [Porospora cf. gigantea B]|uniref:uncharacterized protein n=1 Tax=Porospora cf. gigantea A TaxID=2853593 RepID=UPI00355A1656|nr:MAG: hypothetical protein KVP18_005117 [Porospora cf. gigantea A]KAH0478805.1 MAG: hypothetical protein KVP17_002252 [Porospora cf. gigantea B]